ncbi:MFS general substrate transporter [Coniophora puteana RWD-64-598 SS2]|uniref:MFS general substrate transporter n=1 Tax=Coniophora puteana (strain RWD-64-598) TaxID=741705 RepID=A0A5M3MKT2_CONPW|nr:MFS general substrate transporter [Coniophora puteana RWD-64-598 SS2]EIW79693.1 MFS general substrate transporter [Coniophora puteana RWD-64-598 SS2]
MAADDRSDSHLSTPPSPTAVDTKNGQAEGGKEIAPVGAKDVEDKPYSIYSYREKWFIVIIASVAGTFSPLTANIYFPAIPTIAVAFNKSEELINLTVTVYMVLQGVAPMLWGTMADRVGRRPIFLVCILVLALACVGLALTPTNAYWLLMLLRCVQAAGSASTVALGAGVIGDIATPSERGGFYGLFSIGPMLGPSIGPILGGVFAQQLGWRWIFWFLCILSTACLVFMVLFLPETLRRLVDDGSVTPSKIYRPLIPLMGRGHISLTKEIPPPRPFKNPLWLFTYPDVLNLLVLVGLFYASFSATLATISTLFNEVYPWLTETELGLVYLGTGGGLMLGSIFIGKMLNKDYQRFKAVFDKKSGTDPEKAATHESGSTDLDFPVEKARLRIVPLFILINAAATFGYGWCLQKKVNLAGPLILTIIQGFVSVAIMSSQQTLLVDLVPTQGSSVTACNNIVRCALGAASVSVIDLIIKAVGPGWTFVIYGFICLISLPMVWLAEYIGPKCRAKRHAKESR